jgi:TPP-dependent pyruvate/acetoin dehydrogenase alpha subunit
MGAGIVHIVDPDRGVIGQSGTLGGSQLIAAGAALSSKLRHSGQVTMCFFGDGAANRGTFHEAANVAGAWKLPIVFVIQNNGWAVSVPVEHSTGGRFVDRAIGYGMSGVQVNGADPMAVYEAAVTAVSRARNGEGATIIEAKTVRLQGHYFGDPDDYRGKGLRAEAAQSDPIVLTRAYLLSQGTSEAEIVAAERAALAEVTVARDKALTGKAPGPERIFEDIYV